MLSTSPGSIPTTADELEQALLTVDRIKARSIVKAYAEEHTPFDLVENLFAPAMERIGLGWETGETALSQIFMSGQICAELAEGLEWGEAEKPWPQKRMAIACWKTTTCWANRWSTAPLRPVVMICWTMGAWR